MPLSPPRSRACPALFAALLLLPVGPWVPAAEAQAIRQPFRAEGDAALDALAAQGGWPGSGTPEDPYVVAGGTYFVPVSSFVKAAVHLVNTSRHVVLQDNAFRGGNVPRFPGGGAGVLLEDARNVRVQGNTMSNVTTGVAMRQPAGAPPGGLVVEGNTFTSPLRGVDLGGAVGAAVRGNTFHGAGWAVAGRDDRGTQVEANLMVDGRRGVEFRASEAPRIVGNELLRHASLALDLVDSPRAMVVGNTARGNVQGISLASSPDSEVRDTVASGSPASLGFRVYASPGTLLRNLTADGNIHGISVSLSDNAVVEGSRARGNAHAGISLDVSRHGKVHGNVVDGGIYGIIVGGLSTATANRVTGASEAGIFTSGFSRVEGNLVRGAKVGVLSSSFGSDVVGNDLANHTVSAVHALSQLGGSVEGNTIADSPEGVNVTAGLGVRVAGNRVAVPANGTGLYLRGIGVVADGNTVQGGAVGIRAWALLRGEVAGNDVRNATTGVRLELTQNATLRRNVLEGNAVGLLVDLGTSGNLVYDNLFRNARNVHVRAAGTAWDVPKAPGPNVIGGPFVGGNFWHDHLGADADGDLLGEVPHGPVPYGDPAYEAVAARLPDRGPVDVLLRYGPHDRRPLMALPVAVPLPATPATPALPALPALPP